MRDIFDKLSHSRYAPVDGAVGEPDGKIYFMGICEVCGDYDHVTHNEAGQTVCGWCIDHKVIGSWKNKRLVRSIKREEIDNGRA